MKILVVDDQRTNRQFLLTLLGYMNHRLLEAADGAAALELIRSEKPDLVLTDILMPVMDGYQLTQQIRADPDIADTPVIFYTATYRAAQARALADACGVSTVLPKPSEPQIILDAVNAAIGSQTPVPAILAAPASAVEMSKFDRVGRKIASYASELDAMKASFEGVLARFPELMAERDRLRGLSETFSDRIMAMHRLSARLSAMLDIALDVSPELGAGHVVDQFFAGACRTIGAQYVAVGLLDEGRTKVEYVVAKGFPPDLYRDAADVLAGVPGSFIVQPGSRRPAAAAAGFPAGHPRVTNFVGSSIASRDQVHGWIYFANALDEEFTDDDELIIAVLSTQFAMYYENARLYDLVQRHSAQLQIEMTKRAQAEGELRRVDQQLAHSQKMEAIGQLTGGIAHDFNNLLTVITCSAGVLAESLADQPRVVAVVGMIDEAAMRGAQLTRQLLAFARKQPLQPLVTHINSLVESTNRLLMPTLGEQVKIETLCAPDAGQALVDPSHLSSALVNLAVNARDAMPNGGRLLIETRSAYLDDTYARSHVEVTPGHYVMIAVTDTGSGIPNAVLDRVFEPFFTTKDVGKGTGLGLSMVYGFVKQSGGHIKVCSEPSLGTSFKIYLPRVDAQPVRFVIAPETLAIAGGSDAVLIVEDDILVAGLVSAQLRSLGYPNFIAYDGPQALAAVDAGAEFSLLLTDVVLPGGMNGRQLSDEILRRRPSVKVLYTSGYMQNSIAHHGGLDDPGVLLLEKPYGRAKLAKMVRLALEAA